jgi:crotonobetainyl-CoA:carnitine CoA-transferase CaiB-like acyl-CoA transferase
MAERSTLQGGRVLTLAVNLPGPVAAHRLAELGARVVKIEPVSGDPLAFAQPDLYRHLHAKVEVRAADLKSPDGQGELRALLAETDVLLTSSRLAALDRLGLGWPALGEAFPRLCHVAIVGNAPPREQHPGHDLTYQAQHGLIAPPAMPRSLYADLGGAMEAVLAALGLLYGRLQAEMAGESGLPPERRRAVVPLEDAAKYFAMTVQWGLTSPSGVLGGALPQYNLYQAKEGWIAIAALEPHFWTRFQAELGLQNPSRVELELIFQKRSAQEWQQWAEQNDLPIVAVCT